MQYEVECTVTVWVEVKAKNSKEAHDLASQTVLDIMKENFKGVNILVTSKKTREII